MITREMLRAFAPRPSSVSKAAIWDGYARAIVDQPELFADAHINSDLRLAHLMAQWGHESGGFTILWESGAYSAQRIVEVFGIGRHSAGVMRDEAEEIASLPIPTREDRLFERVYGLGNPRKAAELGNTEPGDGARYRGWGIGQLTGGRDHRRLIRGDYSYENAVRVALIEWAEKGCNRWADVDDIRRVTKAINGGYNGLSDREARLRKAKVVFAGAMDVQNGLDRRPVAIVPKPANEDAEPEARPLPVPTETPRPTVRDLAAMGSTKAAKADAAKKWSIRTLWATIVTYVTDKMVDLSPADIKAAPDTINQFIDTAKVATSFARENALLLIVLGAVAGYWLAHTFGEAMVRDYLEGRYKPRDNEET